MPDPRLSHRFWGALVFILVLVIIFPFAEEAYRSNIVSSLKKNYIEANDIRGYLDLFNADYQRVPIYTAPGVIQNDCDSKELRSFGYLGCFSWDKFAGVDAIMTNSENGLGDSAIVSRNCYNLTCKYISKYGAFVSYIDNADATEIRRRSKTDRTCKPRQYADNVFGYDVQYCMSLTFYDDVLVRASFDALVAQPKYAWIFLDVWFREELYLSLDFGRHSVEFAGHETTIDKLEAEIE